MRRLIRRRKRLTALSLMLAMAACIVTLAGWKWFEPTVTAQAGITIQQIEAVREAGAQVFGIVDFKQPPADTTFGTDYHKSISAQALKNGGSATANGDLDASLAVNGDQLQYSSAVSGQATFNPNGDTNPSSGAEFQAHTRVSFRVAQRSQFSLSGSISAPSGGNVVGNVIFKGTSIDEEIILQTSDFNNPPKTLNISKTGIIEPGSYFIQLVGEASISRFTTTTNAVSVASNVTLSISPIPPPNEFHWINPAGGDFGNAANWKPAGVPGASDTAIFDLLGAGPVTVTAQNVSVASLRNLGMDLELHGSVQVLSSQFGFVVDQGGQLLLKNGATLTTQDGSISGSVFVNGAGTKWTIGTSELDIGFRGGWRGRRR